MTTVSASMVVAIRGEHEMALRSVGQFLEHAANCGELLAQAKADVGHGGWLQWLAENFPASPRTASDYMRLAANRQRVADLGEVSIRGALAALSVGGRDSGEEAAEDLGANGQDVAADVDAEEVDGEVVTVSRRESRRLLIGDPDSSVPPQRSQKMDKIIFNVHDTLTHPQMLMERPDWFREVMAEMDSVEREEFEKAATESISALRALRTIVREVAS